MNRLKRCWINQPSTLQIYHKLHGTNVLADFRNSDDIIIYFISGDVISQQIDRLALSDGWNTNKYRKNKTEVNQFNEGLI